MIEALCFIVAGYLAGRVHQICRCTNECRHADWLLTLRSRLDNGDISGATTMVRAALEGGIK